MFSTLISAFNVGPAELVAITGGGGKSSLMFALAEELPGSVVVTTTTRIFTTQIKLSPAVCVLDEESGRQLPAATSSSGEPAGLSDLASHLARHDLCLVVGRLEGEKARGVPRELPGQLLARPDVDFVLVEADGSRMRPCKAPAAHEPVIPDEATLVVPVAGIDALGRPLTEVAHRPKLVAALTGLGLSDKMTESALAMLISHPRGGLKGVPARARVVPFLNKVESEEQLLAGRRLARQVLRQDRIDSMVLGAVREPRRVLEVHQRVTAVVLAAGQAKRMGRTKQLLPWGGTTVLGQTLAHLQSSALYDSVVVTGHEAEAVAAVATNHSLPTVHNPQFASGEMISSLQMAIRQLPRNRAAVLVMLADQPFVEPQTIDRLLAAFWQGKGELIAPVYQGRRGNPVLIGRRYFSELLSLPAGSAPRQLLERHPDELQLVEVDSDSVLRDIDRAEQYKRWRPGL